MTSLHGRNFVAGSLRESARSFTASSPLDGHELPGRFSMAALDDVEAAMLAAAAAAPVFGGSSGAVRATLLETIAAGLMELGDPLIERANAETALPPARLVGERARTCGQLHLFAAAARDGSWVDARIDRRQPDRQPLPRPDLRRMKRPLGPVVVFGSSNFPLAFSVAGGDTASGLCTGNPVVVKAHRAHPGTSELVAGVIQRAVETCGLPPGTFSMLHGEGSVIGTALVRHPACRAVGFTGSRAAGRALCDAAAARPEPGLVFAVESGDLSGFRTALGEAIAAAAPGSMLSPDIRAAFENGRQALLNVAGTAILGRAATAADPAKTEAAGLIAVTDGATFLDHERLAEEVFGPWSLVVVVKTVAELRTMARHLDGQLTATIHGTAEDLAAAGDLLELLEHKAGRLIVNGFPTGVEVCHAMQHGGPWPATSDARFTSVGTAALERFIRPVCYQDVPDALLPAALQDANPLGIERIVEGVRGRQ
ncbi:MAG: aldehyde dehydrogenase (NADP(+)) [Planctomycetaceae bacterium]|nr:aldehyde dehydrogenase (NADP(+)) [Planctomycetaceae bacterium]